MASSPPNQEFPSRKWQWILGIGLALVGAVDEVNEAVFGDRRTTGGMMLLMLVAGVLAGRALDRWKDRTRCDGDATSSMYYFNRDNSFHCLGQHDRAIADFTEAIRLNAKDSDSYASRGRLTERWGMKPALPGTSVRLKH